MIIRSLYTGILAACFASSVCVAPLLNMGRKDEAISPDFAGNHSSARTQGSSLFTRQSSGQESTNSPGSLSKPVTLPAAQVTARLVQVSVVVHDKSGRPIKGLKANDFALSDNNHPENVQFFSEEVNQDTAASEPPLPPNTFTNKIRASGGELRNVTVILLDGLNTPLLDQSYAKDQLVKFLRQVQPEDHIAIYTLGQTLRMLQDFTSDSSRLVGALRNYKGRLSSGLEASQEWNDSPLQTLLMPKDAYASASDSVEERVGITSQAFEDIANHVSTISGRKNLIWVSGSFPIVVGLDPNLPEGEDARSFSHQIDHLTEVLNGANLVVYPVDARGIVGADLGQATASEAMASGPSGEGDPASLSTLWTVADLTGGRAYVNNNDIEGCIRDAMNDAQDTYELEYSPEGIKWDGSYHRIQVKVNIQNAKVRARHGYFATPLPNPEAELRTVIMSDAARSPLDATGIGLTARVMAKDETTRKLALVVYLDLHQIFFQESEGKWGGQVEALLAQVDSHDQIVGTDDKIFTFNLAQDLFHKLLSQGATYSKEVAFDPRAVEMRIVFRDMSTGNIGSLRIPLQQYFPALKSKK
jgi:VWFA-related protein